MSESLEEVERRYEATIARIEVQLVEAQNERDAALAVIHQACDALDPQDDHTLGQRIIHTRRALALPPTDALEAVRATAWDQGASRVHNVTLDELEWPISAFMHENPYRTEAP